jgi:beta-mannosidase
MPLLDAAWETARCGPGEHLDPSGTGDLEWLRARVPGTVAGALHDAGLWQPGEPIDLDSEDWWFRARFDEEPAAEGEEVVLKIEGLATVADVFLNGEPLLRVESMFVSHELEVGALLRPGGNELQIRCHALGPLVATPRKPRARWRQKLVAGGLRFHRTMLLGRAPGIAPGPQAVGPWRPIRLERRRLLAVEELAIRARLRGSAGVVGVRARLRPIADAPTRVEVELTGASGTHRAPLSLSESADGVIEARGQLEIPDVALWWPHTHGEPALHDVRLHIGAGAESMALDGGRVGFRELAPGPTPNHDAQAEGLDLHVNGVRVFVRGAVWTPVDFVGLAASEEELRAALERAREAGMNMVRLPGTGAYESPAFHDLCDELGILVWQDFMFANMDYPIGDEAFRRSVEREVAQALEALGARPSLAVLCGNSEVEQQVAMLGLDPAMGRGELFGELLPRLMADAGVDVPYLPSAPCGGERPFRTDAGIANYYGVGGYLRPLDDVRRAEVRFASECLAIANLPDGPQPSGEDRAGVPRDAGAEWDFEDVRDHYLRLLFDLDPARLRADDPQRYLELSRVVSGEVMAAVFGEWRRPGSPCGGGLILWMRDLEPGAGWGLVDRLGTPKAAYGYLRRALAPIAVWTSDEGLNGVGVHVANDGPLPLEARLRVALYRDFEHPTAEAERELALAPHDSVSTDVESILGRFVDASWAYRFGPPAQDLIVTSLEREAPGGAELISRAFHFPVGRPSEVESPSALGFRAEAHRAGDGSVRLVVEATRCVHGVRIDAPGFEADDDAFSLEPGCAHGVNLKVMGPGSSAGAIAVRALNMRGSVAVPPPPG